MAWQTQLFCFSAIRKLGKHPRIIVHKSKEELRSEFHMLNNEGCAVIEAPSFRFHPKGEFPPRNELGSLLKIAENICSETTHILFCEPDMLFVRGLEYTDAVAGEYYKYLDYKEDRVTRVARKLNIVQLLETLNETAKIGVPYLIPARHIRRIASRWIEVFDSFESLQWYDIMYAFGLALALEGLQTEVTRFMDTNRHCMAPLSGRLIHYCYGDIAWNKRDFFSGKTPFDVPDPELPTCGPDTILGEMIAQIREAREFCKASHDFHA